MQLVFLQPFLIIRHGAYLLPEKDLAGAVPCFLKCFLECCIHAYPAVAFSQSVSNTATISFTSSPSTVTSASLFSVSALFEKFILPTSAFLPSTMTNFECVSL